MQRNGADLLHRSCYTPVLAAGLKVAVMVLEFGVLVLVVGLLVVLAVVALRQ